MQSTIREVLVKQAGVEVRSVACPSNVNIARGVVTLCTATLVGGDTVRFAARQTDAHGHIHVGPAEMIALEVQNRIRSALRARGVRATASCPQHVPIDVGRTFACVARDARGRPTRIGVTITDSGAGFRMRLLAAPA